MAFASGIPDITGVLNQLGGAMKLVGGSNGLIANVALLTGGFFVVQAMQRAYGMATNPHSQTSVGGLVAGIFWGTILINFWASQQSVAEQLALTGGVLSPDLPSQYMQQMWDALKVVMNGFGTIAVFRGFLLAKAAGDGTARGHNSPGWGAFWHVFGGVLLMQM